MDYLTNLEIQQIYSCSDNFDLCFYHIFGDESNYIDKSIYDDLRNTFNDAKNGIPKAYDSFVNKVQAVIAIVYDDVDKIKPKGYNK